MKVLIVDDDLAIADVLSFTMRRAGYEVITAHDGITALDRWEVHQPDIIILDLNMPKLDGLSVCRRIRTKAETPIIILSVRGEEDDIVEGLKIGADDYITKPFSPRQLAARVEAVLRRAGSPPLIPQEVNAGGIHLDPSRLVVKRADQVSVNLTRLECKLLEVMMINSGQVLPYDTLIDSVWGRDGGDKVMLKQLMYRLRKKVEIEGAVEPLFETVPGVGYSFNSKN